MHKVIFDTDPGVDDAMALLFLARHPEIDLIGITTAFGNASIETTTRNAQYLKQQWGISAPIAKGSAEQYDPGRATHPFPAYIHGDDGLGNIGVPDVVDVPLDPRPAHQFIVDSIKANPGEIVLVAVGRMTNLANALKAAPEITGLVKEVIIMGGAFGYHGHSGNVTPVAEANIIGDPHAADEMFAANWPIVVLGLDVTQQCVMTTAYMADIRDRGGKGGQFLWDVTRFYEDFYRKAAGIDGVFGHDSSAVAYLLDPTLYEVRGGPVRVVTEGIAIGQTIQMPNTRRFPAAAEAFAGRPEATVCIEVDAPRFLTLFADIIINAA